MRLISADSSRVVHYKIIVIADLNVSYEQKDQRSELSVNFDPQETCECVLLCQSAAGVVFLVTSLTTAFGKSFFHYELTFQRALRVL